ncbi:cinnamoyl-CoA reductase 1 [Pyrus x bretschneideri]|uniref:cinnamoyl-CoA reductase 1 n=1 Tax=Pyrus x bretschneideri TaxID=225117 RepID=UPI00202FC9E6|nr:cinnamoyl-CoA reductase 1 [Pyrus x bretschneideri]
MYIFQTRGGPNIRLHWHISLNRFILEEPLDPAIKGTLNVLTAAKQGGVSRVVLRSSISAITPSRSWVSDKVKGEDCWTDIDYCKQKGVSYSNA